jgi:hypothetical protein
MSLLQELLALRESKGTMFQVRVSNGDWEDKALHYTDLTDIASNVGGETGDLSELTGLVEDFIGAGPNSRGDNRGSWDEMEFEIQSFDENADVLKIKYTFASVDMSRKEGNYGTPVKKQGVITIMPGN